jgi:hypothetical protein
LATSLGVLSTSKTELGDVEFAVSSIGPGSESAFRPLDQLWPALLRDSYFKHKQPDYLDHMSQDGSILKQRVESLSLGINTTHC